MRLKILLLTPTAPYPPSQGASLRNYFILRGLARSHDVSLLTFVSEPIAAEALTHLQALCTSVKTVPTPERSASDRLRDMITSPLPDMGHRLYSPAFLEKLKELLVQKFDIIQIEGIELARTLPTIRQFSPETKIVFDNHNAETELQRRTAQTDFRRPVRWPVALYSAIQVRKLRRFEQWICDAADAVTAVSETDAAHLARLSPNLNGKIISIPNTIDVYQYRRETLQSDPEFDLVFTGKMDFRPNVDGMIWFLEEVWPLIQQARAQTTLGIVGQKPHPQLVAAVEQAGPQVSITGFVTEIAPYIIGAGVIIMPLRMGSGTRLKLLEGLAAGRPVVSTTLGAEGYFLTPNIHMLLADTPAEFSHAVLELLDNPTLGEQLGAAGREFAEQYDWRRIIPRFEALYWSLIPNTSL